MRKCTPPGLCLFAALAMVFFLSLSYWQWTRSHEKRAAVDASQSMMKAKAEPLDTKLDDYSTIRYKPITVTGTFISDRQLLLDNQILDGRVGYNVLTPLKIRHTNKVVIVDRGWIAANPDRSVEENMTVNTANTTLVGTIYTPYTKGYRLGSMDSDSNWPRVIQYLDYQQIEDRLDISLVPAIVRLSADSGPGFARQWKTVAFGPEKHIGYMLQWLALALAMMVFLIILTRKKHE